MNERRVAVRQKATGALCRASHVRQSDGFVPWRVGCVDLDAGGTHAATVKQRLRSSSPQAREEQS
jgi:hypothetical protein